MQGKFDKAVADVHHDTLDFKELHSNFDKFHGPLAKKLGKLFVERFDEHLDRYFPLMLGAPLPDVMSGLIDDQTTTRARLDDFH